MAAWSARVASRITIAMRPHGGGPMTRTLVGRIALLCLCGVVLAQRPAPGEPQAAKSDAEISFASLKGLAGKWTGVVTTHPHNPEIEGPIQVTMRVASRGS